MDRPDVRLACPGCGHSYSSEQVDVIGHHLGSFLVKCTCVCERVALFLVDTTIRLAPIAFEDVLIAHEFLEGYTGDIKGLFPPPPEVKKE